MDDDIEKLIDRHALKAQASEYDRSVAVTAIAAARREIANVPDGAFYDPQDYLAEVVGRLRTLYATYNDPDGEFTNGRGVIGDLVMDLEGLLQA